MTYSKITSLDFKALDRTPSVGKVARSTWSALVGSTGIRRAASTMFTVSASLGIALLLLLLVSFVTGYESWIDLIVAGLKR